MESKIEERIKNESMACKTIKNKNLVCKDCMFRFDDSDPRKNLTYNDEGRLYAPTSICEKYEEKPNKVLLGKECDEYAKERI